MEEIRLNKYLSMMGVCSRREADHLIETGQVQVDGQTAVMGMKVREGQQVAFQVEERTITLRDAIPRQAVQERENGDGVVYVIEESEGPWGRR